MDKRLIKLLTTKRKDIKDGVMLDTYNQSIQEEVSCTIRVNINTANHHFIIEEAKIIKEGNYSPSGHNASSIVSIEGISPTVMENHGTVTAIKEPREDGASVQKDNYICIPEATQKGYAEIHEGDSVNLAAMSRERVGEQMANTLDTGCQQGVVERANDIPFRIRKLTPRECFRLMGVDDKDIDKIQSSGISNSSQYKLAGNSIVVDTLYYLLKQLLITNKNEEQEEIQLKLF